MSVQISCSNYKGEYKTVQQCMIAINQGEIIIGKPPKSVNLQNSAIHFDDTVSSAK